MGEKILLTSFVFLVFFSIAVKSFDIEKLRVTKSFTLSAVAWFVVFGWLAAVCGVPVGAVMWIWDL